MDLKQRTAKNILVKYVVTTLVLWGLLIGIAFGIFWWGIRAENEIVNALIAPLIMIILASPFFIPDKSARVALNHQAILASDKHLSHLSRMITLANIVIYSLPFIILFTLINEASFYVAGGIGLVVVNLFVFLGSFRKFQPRKSQSSKETKLTPKVQISSDERIEKDGNGEIIGLKIEELSTFKIYPTKLDIKTVYQNSLFQMVVFAFLGLTAGVVFNQLSLFIVILFLSPILSFGCFYYRSNFFRFKRKPATFEVEHGYHLTKMIFKSNLILLSTCLVLITLLVTYLIRDRFSCTPTHRLLTGFVQIWLFFVLAFLPLFISSHLYFKKLERDASEAGRFVEISPLNSQKLVFKRKKNDKNLRSFLVDVGLEKMDYLVGFRAFRMNIDDQNHQSPPPTVMVFDNHKAHIFSYYVGSKRIRYHLSFPFSKVMILKTLEHQFERRVQFLVGDQINILFIVNTKRKDFVHQEEMFQKFIDLNRKEEL